MTEPRGLTHYEIEIDGHATDRVLRPVIDDFAVELTSWGTTRLVGEVRDASHLNGLLIHFTSLNADVVSLRRIDHDATRDPITDQHLPEKDQP